MFVVHKTVIDLRQSPSEFSSHDFSHQDLRLTQLLFGEPLHLLKKEKDYLYVEAIFHEHHNEDSWHAYRGYVRKDEVTPTKEYHPPTHVTNVPWTYLEGIPLSFGTYVSLDNSGQAILPNGKKVPINKAHLRPLHSPFCRDRLLSDASHFLGAPYLWGGASMHSEKMVSSVDCSGLIYLLYRAQGILIPRDAHPQSLKGRRIARDELQKGDLIYLSKESNPGRASHVLLYKDRHTYLESPQTGEKVAEKKFADHYKEEGALVTIVGRKDRYYPMYISFT